MYDTILFTISKYENLGKTYAILATAKLSWLRLYELSFDYKNKLP
jgi:hypothetical protein